MRAAGREVIKRGDRQLSVGVLAGNGAAEAAYARQGFCLAGLVLFKEIGKRDNDPK